MKKLFAVVTGSLVVLGTGLVVTSAHADEYEGVTYTSSACGVVDIVNGRSTDILVAFQGSETLVSAGGATTLSDPGQEEVTFIVALDRGVASTITYATVCDEPDPDPKPTPSVNNRPKAKVLYAAPNTGV